MRETDEAKLSPIIHKEDLRLLVGDLNPVLNPGQQNAIRLMLSSNNRFVGIQGDAGTGKTYTVKKALDLIKKKDASIVSLAQKRRDRVLKRIYSMKSLTLKQKVLMRLNARAKYAPKVDDCWKVKVVAPYSNQVKALREEGMDAITLASFIRNNNPVELDNKTLVILDEAGVVSAKQMTALMKKIEKSGARLVMLGDTKQMAAIEAGKPFAQLQEAGMKTERIHEIQRQTNLELKESVEHAANAAILWSLENINIAEIKEPQERYVAIVDDYIKLSPQERQQSLILVATNKAKKTLNTHVRDALGLTGKGVEFETLERVDMTTAQKGYAPNYQVNAVIIPEKNFKKFGVEANTAYKIISINEDQTLKIISYAQKEDLKNDNNSALDQQPKEININPAILSKAISVYKLTKSEFSVGDTLKVNRQMRSEKLLLGDHLRVDQVLEGNKGIVVTPIDQSGKTSEKNITLSYEGKPLALEHSYACTIHSSQGLTRERAFLDLPTKGSMTSSNLYYVGLSRAKTDVKIYTDSKKDLPQAISQAASKTAAMELKKSSKKSVKQHAKTTNPEQSNQDAIQHPQTAKKESAQAIIKYAIKHLTEREAVVSQTDLIEAALKRGVGIVVRDEIIQEIDKQVQDGGLLISEPTYKFFGPNAPGEEKTKNGWKEYLKETEKIPDKIAKIKIEKAFKNNLLLETGATYTTSIARKREKAILAIERDGRGQVKPIINKAELKRLEGDLSAVLNPGQQNAAYLMLSSNNRFAGIQGDAGTGKTYTVKKALDLIEKKNALIVSQTKKRRDKVIKRIYSMKSLTRRQKASMILNASEKYAPKVNDLWKVKAIAPYSNQVKALREEGMDASTLASFTRPHKSVPIDDKTLVVLDEAGVVPARQMVELMKKIESSGSRLVMLGDTKQMTAIEAGKPFAQLQEAGMKTERIHEIQRQTNLDLKKSVEYAANSKIKPSLEKISVINDIENELERHKAIVADYMKLSPQERQQSLILVATNKAKKYINSKVRAALDLKGKGHDFNTLERIDMTKAQKGYAFSYKSDTSNYVIIPEKNFDKLGIKANTAYKILDVTKNKTLLVVPYDKQRDSTEIKIVAPDKIASSVSVYKDIKSEFAEGDILRVNRKIPEKNLTLGDQLRVDATIGEKGIVVTPIDQNGKPNGAQINLLAEQKPLPVEHSYACTIHSSQGLTRERAFLDLPSRGQMPSTNLYYVGLSRAKKNVKIYTDDIKKLPIALSKAAPKTTAMELNKAQIGKKNKSLQKNTPVTNGKKDMGIGMV